MKVMRLWMLTVALAGLSVGTAQADVWDDEELGITFGGWMDFDGRWQDTDDFEPFFDLHHVYLLADAQLDSTWRTFFELEFEHAPRADSGGTAGVLKLDRGWIEGAFNEYAKLRFGKFDTPLGIRSPAHWLALVPVLNKPIHENNGYVPNRSVGISLGGSTFLGNAQVDYTVFVSDGKEMHGTNKPEDGITGMGADLSARISDAYLVGVSFFRMDDAGDDRTETSVDAYLQLDLPVNVMLRAEYFRQMRSEGDDVDTLYGLFDYRVHGAEQFGLAYRFDWGKDEKVAGGEVHMVHNANIQWRATPAVRFVLETDIHKFSDEAKDGGAEDFMGVTFWTGAIF